MNSLAHIFLTYIAINFIIPDAKKYLIPIALFAFILDLDHLPGFMKTLLMTKRQKARLRLIDYVNMFRTTLQEPISIITIEILLILLYLFGLNHILIIIAGLSIGLHWLIDFLTVHTRPYAPINNKIVCLFFSTKKQRVVSEIFITAVSILLFAIVYF